MSSGITGRDSAAVAYDAFAQVYDRFNAGNGYELWLGEVLLPELKKHGLVQGKVLDVGCGTGQAFDALLRRGWVVSGCDLSQEMLRQADEKFGPLVSVLHADARDLPEYTHRFDLILLLNDVVNYLVDDGDLERCFDGVAKNLKPGGLICFDTNTLGLFRHNFAGPGMDRGDWTWRGSAASVEPGRTYEAIVSGPGVEENVHRQRHWTDEQIRGALGAAGVECLVRRGHFEDETIILHEVADEERDLKSIYVAGHRHGE